MKRKIVTINQKLCNGCGICASACHEGAITIEDGKARLISDDYCDGLGDCLPACPTGAITIEEREAGAYDEAAVKKKMKETTMHLPSPESQIASWPVQIRLVPTKAPYFDGSNLLIAADCTAYAYADFHRHFMKDHITLIGCPKLDSVDYSEKLAEIIKENKIKTVTVVRMEVPCCRGIELAVSAALKKSGKDLPWRTVVVSTEGNLILPS